MHDGVCCLALVYNNECVAHSDKMPMEERPPIPYVPELDDPAWKPVYGEIEFDCPHWGTTFVVVPIIFLLLYPFFSCCCTFSCPHPYVLVHRCL